MRRRANGFNKSKVTFPGIVGDLQYAKILDRKQRGTPLDSEGLSERSGDDAGDFWPGFLLTPVPSDLFVRFTREDFELLLGRGGIFRPKHDRDKALRALFEFVQLPPDPSHSDAYYERVCAENAVARKLLIEVADEARIKKLAQAIYTKLRGRAAMFAMSRDERNDAIRDMHVRFPHWTQRKLADHFRVSVGTINGVLSKPL